MYSEFTRLPGGIRKYHGSVSQSRYLASSSIFDAGNSRIRIKFLIRLITAVLQRHKKTFWNFRVGLLLLVSDSFRRCVNTERLVAVKAKKLYLLGRTSFSLGFVIEYQLTTSC